MKAENINCSGGLFNYVTAPAICKWTCLLKAFLRTQLLLFIRPIVEVCSQRFRGYAVKMVVNDISNTYFARVTEDSDFAAIAAKSD